MLFDAPKTYSGFPLEVILGLSFVFTLNLNLNAEEPVAEKADTSTEEVQTNENVPGDKYQLEYKFSPNQIIKYHILNTTSIDTSKGEFNDVNSNESETVMHYRVVSVDSEKITTLEPVLDQVKMTANFYNAEPISYDSNDSEEAPPQFAGVDESIGKPLSRFKYNQYGKLLEILDLRNAGEGDPEVTNETNSSVELLANQSFLVIFPDHPVAIGEKWNEKYETFLMVSESLNEKVEFLRKYELESVENNVATIKLNTILVSQIQDPKQRLQLIQKAPTGKLTFDMEQGILTYRELDVEQTEFGIFGQGSKIKVTSKKTEKYLK